MNHGIVRLRVRPTTVEETQRALSLMMEHVDDRELVGALVIISPSHIRVRTSQSRRENPG